MNKAAKDLGEQMALYLASFEADNIPKGWYSMKELSEAHGTGIRNVNIIVRKLMKFKQAEVKTYKVATGGGIQRVPYYKFSKEAAKVLGLKNA